MPIWCSWLKKELCYLISSTIPSLQQQKEICTSLPLWASLPQQTVEDISVRYWDAAALLQVYQTSTSVKPLRWITSPTVLLLHLSSISSLLLTSCVECSFHTMVKVSFKRFSLRCPLLVAFALNAFEKPSRLYSS